ncbi:hypothetical protein EYF80_038165 [Liparis tanakae]|uniref:Uncharacterized protein n=1 Tax=Liparis tanakae TaxID=230148 RepID=A0A4Z2GE61_9TELE|nr:hypothetical protein EYF80_038165 [Liparis tanakae]
MRAFPVLSAGRCQPGCSAQSSLDNGSVSRDPRSKSQACDSALARHAERMGERVRGEETRSNGEPGLDVAIILALNGREYKLQLALKQLDIRPVDGALDV